MQALTHMTLTDGLTEQGQTLWIVMLLYYVLACLTYHGKLKGDLDISGYPKEGHRKGDLAGAITVTALLNLCSVQPTDATPS